MSKSRHIGPLAASVLVAILTFTGCDHSHDDNYSADPTFTKYDDVTLS